MNISVSEFAALALVLSNISVKDLLHNAMIGLAESEETNNQDLANVCSQAINGFLK